MWPHLIDLSLPLPRNCANAKPLQVRHSTRFVRVLATDVLRICRRRFAARAGTALLFDTACWHTAMPNVPGNLDRRSVILGWKAAVQSASPLLTAAHLAELEASGRLTPTLQKLVGAPEQL